MTATHLERGQPYPLDLSTREGAAAQFLVRGGSILQVVLPGMTAQEERALRSGDLQAGMLRSDDLILLLFRFLGPHGAVLTLDAPFDIRLLVQVHGVDERNILRALRATTLPAGLTREFLSAVMDQVAAPPGTRMPPPEWQSEPVELARNCRMHLCGR